MEPIAFLDAVSGYATADSKSSADRPIRIAVIDPTFDAFQNYPDPPQLPKVTFEGESVLSTKRYAYANGFLPAPGQRVYMVPVGTTYLISGAVQNPNVQGFYAQPTADLYTTEFGDANYVEVEAGIGTLVIDDVRMSGTAYMAGQRGYVLSKQAKVLMPANLGITASDQDMCSVTFSTLKANAKWKVSGFYNYENTTGGTAAILIGTLMVDGVTQSSEAVFWSGAGHRAMVGQQWEGTFASAGSHTIKLRARVLNVVGVPFMYGTHTNFIYEIYE